MMWCLTAMIVAVEDYTLSPGNQTAGSLTHKCGCADRFFDVFLFVFSVCFARCPHCLDFFVTDLHCVDPRPNLILCFSSGFARRPLTADL